MAAVAVLALVACSAGPRGLGRAACPYVRPRIIRLDTDRLHVPQALGDIRAVSQDFSDYVHTNLPDAGKARADRPLVRFSAALNAYVNGHPQQLAATEQALERECRVSGY